jgi:hypothetical protein
MISIAIGLVAVATTVHGELSWSAAPSQAEDKVCPGQQNIFNNSDVYSYVMSIKNVHGIS